MIQIKSLQSIQQVAYTIICNYVVLHTYDDMLLLAFSWTSSPVLFTVKTLVSGTPTCWYAYASCNIKSSSSQYPAQKTQCHSSLCSVYMQRLQSIQMRKLEYLAYKQT